jgi:hypothetical protein
MSEDNNGALFGLRSSDPHLLGIAVVDLCNPSRLGERAWCGQAHFPRALVFLIDERQAAAAMETQ